MPAPVIVLLKFSRVSLAALPMTWLPVSSVTVPAPVS